MSQVYGYIVCIIAVITMLFSLGGVITSVIDSMDPLYTWGDTNHLSSFENFKLNALNTGKADIAYIPDDETLRVMYEDAKTHKIRRVMHETKKTITVSSILIVISILLFLVHWRWMRRIDKKEE